MESISRTASFSAGGVPVTRPKAATTGTNADSVSPVFEMHESRSDVSALGRQLAAAAQRAAARDSQLSRQELAELGSRIQMGLPGQGYVYTKALHDAFIPDTQDQALLARARQATDFINGNDANPFKHLTTEQLALIGYDEGEDFTYNERLAASAELGHRYSQWTRYIVDKANAEYDRTGFTDDALREMIDYYKKLPPIMEAGFRNYEFDLTAMIGKSEPPRGDEADSLIETLLKTARKLEDQAKKDHPPLEGPDESGKPA
ncbi:hypothetical protein JET66_09980 [Pseudomonas putida]|uniref:hypothetical protein n=1 Tax=Pseudomonas putida TaxID=303 RepID=UPI0018E67367|nr:hypothetical protein [Pseudomonas putida]MBI6924984.1 hypothetical protein [Pseudomonas putida]